VAVVVSSLIGGNADTGARKYVIDYAGGPLEGRLPIGAVAGSVRVRPDTFVTQDAVGFNPYTGGYRQVVQVMPVPGRTVQVRAWLDLGGQVISEIWRYALFTPRVAH
jgi:glucans biosynthesis protein